MDQGDRKALLLANSYIYGLGASWTESTNSFLTGYVGLAFENIVDLSSSKEALLQTLLNY